MAPPGGWIVSHCVLGAAFRVDFRRSRNKIGGDWDAGRERQRRIASDPPLRCRRLHSAPPLSETRPACLFAISPVGRAAIFDPRAAVSAGCAVAATGPRPRTRSCVFRVAVSASLQRYNVKALQQWTRVLVLGEFIIAITRFRLCTK